MKRRHESTIDGIPWPQPENTENIPNQVYKKRRMVHNDGWSGLCRRRSLRDINNLSDPASIPHDEKTTLKVTQSRIQRTPVIDSGKEATPESVHTGPDIPLHGSCSQHQAALTNSRSLPTSVPDQQASVSGPVSCSSSKISRVAVTHPLPRFASHENPDDDSDNDSDEESDNEPESGLGTQIDSDEKQRVESNYSEMNKLLGNLFLSRHRGRS